MNAIARAEEKSMQTYNVFRSTQLDDLCCAVPEGRAVPSFIAEPAWSYEGKVRAPEAQRGFSPDAAVAGVRFNGFYLFQAL